MKKIIFVLITILVLSGCDNLVDKSDQGTVQINLSDLGSQRYIAGDGATVDEAVLGFIEEDVMYNFDSTEDITDFDGQYLFTGIPVGNYAFLAILMADGDIISTAIQGVTIEAGYNYIPIQMGPGLDLKINGNELDMDDLSVVFTLSFKGDEITIGMPASELISNMTIEVTTNATAMEVLDIDGVNRSHFAVSYTAPVNELAFSTGTVLFDGTKYPNFQLKLKSADNTVNTYKVRLTEK